MRRNLIFSAATLLCLGGPVFAQSTDDSTANGAAMRAPGAMQSPSASATTTPSVNRPGDADVRSSNKTGGTGGANSSNNGG